MMRSPRLTFGPTAAALILLVAAFSSLPIDVKAQGLHLQVGDFAVYSLGASLDECYGTTPLYSPLFEFENRSFAGGCPGTIRWEVIGAAEGSFEVFLTMMGWPKDHITLEYEYPSKPPNETVYQSAYALLNAEHILRVETETLDVTTEGGVYVGRWSFHVTSGELASERMELTRNWYSGTTISADLTVVKELPLDTEEVLSRKYGVDTYVFAQTGWISPVPEGIERYLYDVGGGWLQLRASAPIYDPESSLLLVVLSPFYSDLLFNLYGVFWLDQKTRPWPDMQFLTTLKLVDTNLLPLPGSTEGEGGGPGDNGDGGGTPGGDGSPGPPWATIILFSAIAVAVVLVAARWLKPSRREETGVGDVAGEGGQGEGPPRTGKW